MFRQSLLRYHILRTPGESRASLEPTYLDRRYAHLVRSLVEIYKALKGEPYGELKRTLKLVPEVVHYDPRIVSGLRNVVEESVRLEVESPVDPPTLRDTVFSIADRTERLDLGGVYRQAARRLGVEAENLQNYLYADLKDERRLTFTRSIPTTSELIALYNFRLLQGFFLHAERIRVRVFENVRSVYRLAKLNGLLLEVRDSTTDRHAWDRLEGRKGEPQEGLELEITGPLALFKKTRKYGYALARFLPACCATGRYSLEATVVLQKEPLKLRCDTNDRILSSHCLPKVYDSKLEERFYRDFVKLGSDWEISREAQFLRVKSTVFLPDFTLRHRTRPSLSVDLEIVGFWTRDYLARKFALVNELSSSGASRVIFCVDSRLCCDKESSKLPCIFFKGRVPADKVLEALETLAGS